MPNMNTAEKNQHAASLTIHKQCEEALHHKTYLHWDSRTARQRFINNLGNLLCICIVLEYGIAVHVSYIQIAYFTYGLYQSSKVLLKL